jgi:hypothetical protein
MGQLVRVTDAARELGLTPSAVSTMISSGKVPRDKCGLVDLDDVIAATFYGKSKLLREANPDKDFKSPADLAKIFNVSIPHVTAMLRRVGPHRYYVDQRRFLTDFSELVVKLERSRGYNHYLYYGRDYICNVWFNRDGMLS